MIVRWYKFLQLHFTLYVAYKACEHCNLTIKTPTAYICSIFMYVIIGGIFKLKSEVNSVKK